MPGGHVEVLNLRDRWHPLALTLLVYLASKDVREDAAFLYVGQLLYLVAVCVDEVTFLCTIFRCRKHDAVQQSAVSGSVNEEPERMSRDREYEQKKRDLRYKFKKLPRKSTAG